MINKIYLNVKNLLFNNNLYVFFFFDKFINLLEKLINDLDKDIFLSLNSKIFLSSHLKKDVNDILNFFPNFIYFLQKPYLSYAFWAQIFSEKFLKICVKYDLFVNQLFSFFFLDLYGLRIYDNLFFSDIFDYNEGEDFLDMNYLQVRPDEISLHFPILSHSIFDAEVPNIKFRKSTLIERDDDFYSSDFEDYFGNQFYSIDGDEPFKLDDQLNFYSSVFNSHFSSFFGEDSGLFFASKFMHLNTYNDDYFFDDYYMQEEESHLDYLSDEDDAFYYLGDDDLEDVEGQQNVQATATLYEMEFEDDDLDPSSRDIDADSFDIIRDPRYDFYYDEFDYFVTPLNSDFSEFSTAPLYYYASLNSFYVFSFLINRPKLFLVSLDYKHSTLVKFFIYIRFFLRLIPSLLDGWNFAKFFSMSYSYSKTVDMVIYLFFAPRSYFYSLLSSYYFNSFLVSIYGFDVFLLGGFFNGKQFNGSQIDHNNKLNFSSFS